MIVKAGATLALEKSADKGGLPVDSWHEQDESNQNHNEAAMRYMYAGTYGAQTPYGDWMERYYTKQRVMFVLKPA